ncbi:L-lactate permease [Dermatophilus congolensis]|uniref:L-lactate permease n=1 Tax=Dermatophilus congolensis TaxID=1863 RepID=UPI001AAF103C|nr:L-lactate permease [Dermatophilus congolensis]MBO3142279.1 L-lactate permease [Dermatophilus congolensis]MBO3151270.1 L-lactate permease [Dermatophilus congolensis]MBO3161726.1 L-lactate permease [Dermatophilus congolensis]MBO3162556.1 L-lactate permease [Dermatophilus congolensis]MBO3176109.1 L-lactate permease [Dermatophilus congolensis]
MLPALAAFTPNPSPLPSQWLSALVAAIPIMVMLITLGGLRWKAHIAGITSWAVALVIAVTVFSMPVGMALSTSAHGFIYGQFPIVWILLCAIWMYQVTVISGRFDDLRRTFFLISDDPRVLGMLIAFCFGGLLEALAGFGAPVAIATVMLIAIGFSKLRAAVVALLANTVPVAFGAVGLPILTAAQVSGVGVTEVAIITGRVCALLGLLVPFLLLFVMDGKKGVTQCWPFAILIGVIFGATKWIVSATPLYNLTEIFAAVITVAAAIAFLRFWKPRGGEEALARVGAPMDPSLEEQAPARVADDNETLTGGRIFMALVPYILVIVVFSIAAIPAVHNALVATNLKLAWPGLQELMSVSGKPSGHATYTIAWLSGPGTLLALVAILVGIIYKVSFKEIFAELWRNVVKLRFTMLTIGAVVALAYVMGDSGQTYALGLWVAGAGAVYPFLAPILGWIGTYVTGSDTSANLLFSPLQASVGDQIGYKGLLVGTGAAGGVVGKMISPQSLAIAASAIGLAGSESVILRRVISWSLILLVFMCVVSGLMSTPVLAWLLP